MMLRKLWQKTSLTGTTPIEDLRTALGLHRGLVDPEELALAGTVNGALWIAAIAVVLPAMALPAVPSSHDPLLVALAGGALLVGLLSLLAIDWERVPRWGFHLLSVVTVAAIVTTVASAGGAHSPLWVLFELPVLYTAYFYAPRAAALYLAVCTAAQWAPLLYDDRGVRLAFVIQAVIASLIYAFTASSLIVGRALMWLHRQRAGHAISLQSTMTAISSAVAEGAELEPIYVLAAREAATQASAPSAAIMRVRSPATATVLGSWGARDPRRHGRGAALPLPPGSPTELAVSTQQTQVGTLSTESPLFALGYRSQVAAPIRVGGRVWGLVVAPLVIPADACREAPRQLEMFADALAPVVESSQGRAALVRLASTDPLTGLANHGALQSGLAAAVRAAVGADEPLSIALIDVDNFKRVNDAAGHDLGDAILMSVADCLRAAMRGRELLARFGGDEFAWIMPGLHADAALARVEQLRAAIERRTAPLSPVTISAGICDTAAASEPAELLRLADGALYWSKAHGRDSSQIYDPEVVEELSASERAQRLERQQALAGLQALARAVDAKDPATRLHSERVAEFVQRLARAAGWSPERTQLLHQAALVHDVGKLGVPDAILLKPGRLTPDERLQIQEHAEMSARIVTGFLSDEQVEWVRHHHERPDGGGYPDGLLGPEISEGAALIAVADCWDVMVLGRPYSASKSVRRAYDECVELVGRQFTAPAVAALTVLWEVGELNDAAGEPEARPLGGPPPAVAPAAAATPGALPAAALDALALAPAK